MRNTIVKVIIGIAAVLFFCPAALCQNNSFSGLFIENGQMTGTVTAHFSVGTEYESAEEINVDCPVPRKAYLQEILTVADRYVSKKEMQQALKAAGQRTVGKFTNLRGSGVYTGDWNAEARADISKEAAAEQATRIALQYFDALGVEVDPIPRDVFRPYDYDEWMGKQINSYEHRFSDASTFIENAEAYWKLLSKHHPKQSEYTSVSFYILLDGMRLETNPSYPAGYADEPEAWEGFSVSADAIVSDSGILVEASCNLLKIVSRRPMKNDRVYESFLPHSQSRGDILLPGECWQEALITALVNSSPIIQLQKSSSDALYQNKYMDEPIIAFGSRTVITEITPILHTISKKDWAPFWHIETMQQFSDGWRY